MTDKKDELDSDQARKLILFKSKKEIKVKELPKYTFEKFDQEDKIKLITKSKSSGAGYSYSIQLQNESSAPISEVKIKVIYSDFLSITGFYPPTTKLPKSPNDKGKSITRIKFEEINERSSKRIDLRFTPLLLGNEGEIRTMVTYVNNKDYVRVLDSKPVIIKLGKININPKIVPSSYIQKFSQKPDIKKGIISFGVGVEDSIDSNFYFNLLNQILLKNHLQLIAKDPNKKILWFFGTDLESREDVLIIGQIVSAKVEIIGTSPSHNVLISFLTLLSNEFKEHLVIREIVKTPNQIYNMKCKYCGMVLPNFPEKGEEIECRKCSNIQVVW